MAGRGERGGAGWLWLGAAGLLGLAAAGRRRTATEPAPKTAPAPAQREPPRPSKTAAWPLERAKVRRIGQSVLADRNGQGRPHKGVDLFIEAGTPVTAAQAGRVIRVEDGRTSSSESRKRAGLWIDVEGSDGLVYRYLHLGTADVNKGAHVERGQKLGTVAPPNTSGLGDDPHLHFEVRRADYTSLRGEYGTPIDPLTMLA